MNWFGSSKEGDSSHTGTSTPMQWNKDKNLILIGGLI
jgi:hypothetical protein